MKEIEVNFKVQLEDDEFKKILKEAQNLGYDYGDAGPILTVKRFFSHSGLGSLEDMELADRISARIV